jgi:uncharacterized protein YqjF (DUF2071 family)
MDRISPTRRPNARAVQYQKWHHLTFLHWSFPPEVISPLLPPQVTLDTFEGKAYVGMVLFTMVDVRFPGLPAWSYLSNFHETNVRTYVHYKGRDPGVWFFSLDAASAFAAQVARAWFKLPYYHSRMELSSGPGGAWYEYRSSRVWPPPTPATYRARSAPRGPAAASTPGTLQHFLAERYYMYLLSEGTLYRGQVYHTPYPIRPAELLELDESLLAAAGISRPAQPPLVHFSDGVSVDIFPLRRIEG